MMHVETEPRGDLIDISGLSLRELDVRLPESALGAALRNALDHDQGGTVCAGFDSCVPPDTSL
ncbi:hypothetical protein BJF79_29515 [Actinomadura sp. CNU-125]|uniref:hypothetical protein n=1 Tax=Actinomadura sp. CNU-125 TaxID=1904961 RepID=UPI000964122A|nr:hypothetical protein [Actinomadura sp. CNU-125]OLT37374.1 hypothetical protein BJF79_29515 [Actinomadura sp. CNU-125]